MTSVECTSAKEERNGQGKEENGPGGFQGVRKGAGKEGKKATNKGDPSEDLCPNHPRFSPQNSRAMLPRGRLLQ